MRILLRGEQCGEVRLLPGRRLQEQNHAVKPRFAGNGSEVSRLDTLRQGKPGRKRGLRPHDSWRKGGDTLYCDLRSGRGSEKKRQTARDRERKRAGEGESLVVQDSCSSFFGRVSAH